MNYADIISAIDMPNSISPIISARIEEEEKHNRAKMPKFNQSSDTVTSKKKPDVATTHQANEALQKLLKTTEICINKFANFSMKNIGMIAANVSMKSFSDTAKLNMKKIDILADSQAFIRNKQVEQFQKELAEAAKAEASQKSGNIFTAIFDWFVGAVECIIGAFKVLEGVARLAVGDVSGSLEIASGAMYLAAGLSCLVKAAAETAMLAGADKETCESVIGVASKVQIAFEVAGMATDVFQCGRVIMATKNIASTTKAAAQELAPTIGKAIAQNGVDEIATLGQFIGNHVATNVSKKIASQLVKAATENTSQIGQLIQKSSKAFIAQFRQGGVEYVGHLTKSLKSNFSHANIEKMVANVVEKTSETAMKKGVELSSEKIVENIYKGVRNEVIKTAVASCTFMSLEASRAAVTGGKSIGSGALQVSKAQSDKVIQTLINQQSFMSFLHDWGEQNKEITMKNIKDLYEKQSSVLSTTSHSLSKTASIQLQIAAAIIA